MSDNKKLVPTYIQDLIKTYGLEHSIQLTQKHLATADDIAAHPAAIEFLVTVRDELNKLKEKQ